MHAHINVFNVGPIAVLVAQLYEVFDVNIHGVLPSGTQHRVTVEHQSHLRYAYNMSWPLKDRLHQRIIPAAEG